MDVGGSGLTASQFPHSFAPAIASVPQRPHDQGSLEGGGGGGRVVGVWGERREEMERGIPTVEGGEVNSATPE